MTRIGKLCAGHSLAALGMALTVRKTADNQWRLWRGTGTSTWEVFEARFIHLE